MHGSGDENVNFAFTLQFANTLIAANKQFDMMVTPTSTTAAPMQDFMFLPR
jgi:dipeptidyl aminopeptidase/acylaminoacyl peptidase